MKKEELFQAISDIDDAFLDEDVIETHSMPWLSIVLGTAACIAVSVGILHILPKPSTDVEVIYCPAETQAITESAAAVITDEEEAYTLPVSDIDYQLYIAIPPLVDFVEPIYYYFPDCDESWPIMAELEIDPKNGQVSLMAAYSSQSFPSVGVLTASENGYDCQIDGFAFKLEVDPNNLLVFHADQHPLDSVIFTPLIKPYQPFADLQLSDLIDWDLDSNQHLSTDIFPDELMHFLHEATIYTRTLAHDTPTQVLTIRMKDGSQHEISPTATMNDLFIDGFLYHSDDHTQQLFYDFIDKISELSTETENISIDEPEIIETESDMIPIDEPEIIETESDMIPTDEPEIIETESDMIPTAETNIILPEDPVIPEPTSEIPQEIPAFLMEIDGIVYSTDDEPHVEIEPTSGIYTESYLVSAEKYFPDHRYAVQIHMHTGSDHTLSEKIDLLKAFGLDVIGDYHDRVIAIVKKSDLDMLDQHKEYGFLIDLIPDES